MYSIFIVIIIDCKTEKNKEIEYNNVSKEKICHNSSTFIFSKTQTNILTFGFGNYG